MADKETIGISSLISLGIVLVAMLTPGFFDSPKYYCESESKIIECPGGLSGGSHTRCYLVEDKKRWDYCRSGWLEVTNDIVIQEEPEKIPHATSGNKECCSVDVGCYPKIGDSCD